MLGKFFEQTAPIVGAGIGYAVGGPAGGAIGYGIGSSYSASKQNEANIKAQQHANQQNIALAREQMAFQREMSNSAYQRAMDDMQKAGLNPILAYQQGGASTPQGALGQVNAVESRGVELQSQSAQNAMGMLNAITHLKQQNSLANLQDVQAQKIKSETTKIKKTEGIDELQNELSKDAKSLWNYLKREFRSRQKKVNAQDDIMERNRKAVEELRKKGAY